MSKDLKALTRTITLWNESRLDLFAISLPDKNLECHGVIRFYHQDSTNDGKYATKCVRVSSTAATIDVIDTLSEKFRSDMRMLTKPNYALFEVHADGDTRMLKDDENPLIVQLSWIKEDREGRFLLKNEDDKTPVNVGNGLYEESEDTIKGFKLTRNLTKKEKKLKKKKEKEKLHNKNKEENSTPVRPTGDVSAAKQLYSEVPESTFTRTVSNPEAVMKKRREQKLQKRGAEMLKVYGDSINKEIPYKTLLLLPNDKTDIVIRDTLDKYGRGKESASDYMMVQVVLPPGSKPEECFEGGWGKETILGDDDCPLDIEQKWQPHQGTLVFQLRPRTADYAAKKKKTPSDSQEPSASDNKRTDQNDHNNKKLSNNRAVDKPGETERGQKSRKRPKLLELLGSGSQVQPHNIAPNVTEIGCDQRKASYGPFIELRDVPGLKASHCVITNMDGVVTVTPHDGVGEVFVDGKLIEETTMLSHCSVLWLGRNKHLVFCDPGRDISIPDIQRRVRATVPKELRDRKSSQNAPINSRQRREASGSDGDRPRHYSTTSTSSSKSGSLSRGNHPAQERQQLRNIPETVNYQQTRQQRVSQSHLPHQRSTQEGFHQHIGIPPQTVAVQPMQQRQPQRLPVYLQVNRDTEETLISEMLSVRANSLHFKLSPAYCIYLMQRFFVEHSKDKVVPNLLLVTDLLEQTMQLNCASVSELSFWMANTSELLNFIRQDQELTMITMEVQDTFAKTVQLSFRHLVQCMQRTLFDLMPAFLSESDEDLPGGGDAVDLKKQNQNSEDPTMYDILHMLSSAMSLLRRCRVNAALTIQLFSQLFHSVNMWLFNKLVASNDATYFCCREWGMRIRARLAMVETWAEKQGLELAADCHLARITQATHLLQAPKQTGKDIADISGTCFKLNSLQLRALLSNYQPSERDGERLISQDLIDKVVAVAENSADELTRSDGRDVRLEEDPDLQLPFLLPEDGYSCDVVHGIPNGLKEFIKPFAQEGLCTYNVEPNASDSWTVYFQSFSPQYQQTSSTPSLAASDRSDLPAKPEIITIEFNKKGGGMGLSIVAARGAGQDKLGIYIRSVVKGGASDLDGRLQAGDQLLSVDGQSLVGVDQARAAGLMTKTGQTVTLEIAKQGAVYHGLATLLSQPSPKMQHSNFAQRRVNAQPRPKSEGFALYANANEPPRQQPGNYSPRSPAYDMHGRPFTSQTKQPSPLNSSTPHLNEGYRYEGPRRKGANAPRSAISMGNLQQTSQDTQESALGKWKRNRQDNHERAEPPSMANTRRKATSQTTLNTSSAVPTVTDTRQDRLTSGFDKRSYGRKEVPSTSSYSPSENLPSPPILAQPPIDPHRSNEKFPQNSLDNPNYDHFPPPPPDLTNDDSEDVERRHFQPVQPAQSFPPPPPAESPQNDALNHKDTSYEKQRSPSPISEDTKSPPSGRRVAQTLGRPTSGKKPEVARITPTQKKKQNVQTASKSSTLPRHFKSASPWKQDERERKEQSIQEQLNALRDEEIAELTARTDLSPLEKERLKSLLQERDFQARVQEEKMRIFSDEDISGEDYNSVPDRPDRERLIRLEGAHAQRNTSSDKEDKDRLRWEEEQKRKKEEAELRARLEAERREERRRERERQEEKRRKEAEQRELRRQEEERARLQREKEREEEKWRNDYNSLQREEEEQRRRLEELRKMREQEEEQLREIQARREAEERTYRFDALHRDEQEKSLKHKEAEAREEAEREYLETKLSAGKPASNPSYTKYTPKTFSAFSSLGGKTNRSSPGYNTKPVMREHSKASSVRPVSDGYMLGKNDWSSDDLPPPPQPASSTPPSNHSRRPTSYVATTSTPSVIGSQEIYNDPRNRREASIKKDHSFKRRGPDPSRLTFKDRQRMFQGGPNSPVSKPKTSRKLLEIEESLRNQR